MCARVCVGQKRPLAAWPAVAHAEYQTSTAALVLRPQALDPRIGSSIEMVSETILYVVRTPHGSRLQTLYLFDASRFLMRFIRRWVGIMNGHFPGDLVLFDKPMNCHCFIITKRYIADNFPTPIVNGCMHHPDAEGRWTSY